jgi:hypothetical protein
MCATGIVLFLSIEGDLPMKMLATREFWVAVLTLFVLIVGQFMPGFKLDIESAVALGVIVAAYIVGIAVDPGPGWGWRGVIQSRKFWTAAVGIVVIFLDAFGVVLPVDLTPEILVTLVALVGSLIANFSIEGPPQQLPAETAPYIPDETGRS